MLRSVLFWTHLCAGLLAALIILVMSITGVVLTYEHQILAWADRKAYNVQPEPDQQRLPLDALLSRVSPQLDFSPTRVALSADPAAPVILAAGRSDAAFVNPYTGDLHVERSKTLDNFFALNVRLHRWLNLDGDARATGKAITGISNLIFLFLVFTGLYLWLPPTLRWSAARLRLLLRSTGSSAARDLNWHQVFGFWAAIPLMVVIATATVFNYSWATNLVCLLAGDEVPQRNGPPRGAAPAQVSAEGLSVEALFQNAIGAMDDWRTLTLNLSPADAEQVTITVDQGNGRQPQKKHSLNLDVASSEVAAFVPFSEQAPGRKARSWVRFLHTGEALGIVGQTIAGLASLVGVIMVWTGVALSLRRFARFRVRRSRKARNAALSSSAN